MFRPIHTPFNDKWDERFILLARHIADWSKDPGTKVGAVIVRPDRTVASVGYNGLPRNVEDTPARLERPLKYHLTVHAEINAILSAGENLQNYVLYVAPLFPCSNCAAAIIQTGISRIVFDAPDEQPPQWRDSFRLAAELFQEAGVRVERLWLADKDAA